MRVFVIAARADSFAAAAIQLGISAVMVGKHVSALERELGASLLERTTRKQHLTEIGTSYLERCEDVLSSLAAADRVAESLRAVPHGKLRISAPVVYGAQRLPAVIQEYLMIHPEVKIDLILNNRIVDMAEEGFDLAFRSGMLTDIDLVARSLAPMRMQVAASPDYLKKNGVPRHPDDLAKHNLLSLSGWGSGYVLRFGDGQDTIPVHVNGNFTCNYGHGLLAAAVAGIGIVVQSDALLQPHLLTGELVPVLPGWELSTRSMHVVRRAGVRPTAKVKSFVEFAVERLG